MLPIREDFLPFSRPSFGPEEEAELIECLRSGWITTGPRTRALEEAVSAFLGGCEAAAVCSATAGLHLCLLALQAGPDQDVLTTTFTWVSTANVIVHTGAHPVLADIDPGTWNLDPGAVEEIIGRDYFWDAKRNHLINRDTGNRLTIMMPVHYAGQVCDMDRLMELARRYNIRVVEDAAHALGADRDGAKAGLIGDLGCFSFYANKNMTTGEGGMVVTRDPELASRVRRLGFHGLDRDAWKRYAKGGAWYQVVPLPGYKYNLTDLCASLGLHQLKKLPAFNRRRGEIAALYDRGLKGVPGLRLPLDQGRGYHTRHLYPIVATPEAALDRAALIIALGERNIGSGVHYVPVHLHPYYQEALGLRPEDFPRTMEVYEGILSLPLFPSMTDADAAYVVDSLRGLLGAEG